MSSSSDDAEVYCYCGSEGEGEMVGCDGEDCPFGGWFHLECAGLSRVPRGSWLCATCADEETPSKRRREEYIPDDEDGPPLKVEAAERQSRTMMEALLAKAKWVTFHKAGGLETPSPEIEGLCKVKVGKHFEALQDLHRVVVERLRHEKRLTAWAGVSEGDGRERGYAFMPTSFGTSGKTALRNAGVRFHAFGKSGDDAADDEEANWRSCVRLKEADITDDRLAALEGVATLVQNAVPRKYKQLITLDNLQALQPNLHNGLDHLPCHIDHPLNDGFGIVIVTLCISSSATVLILPNHQDAHRAKPRAFDANEGEAYVLSAAARNACDHGIICHLAPTRYKANTNKSSRESLNLRFGLHSAQPGHAFYAFDEMPLLLDLEDEEDD